MPCSPDATTRHPAETWTAQLDPAQSKATPLDPARSRASQLDPTRSGASLLDPARLDPARSDIDLVGPKRACALLNVGDPELLALVNSDRLAAYRLGGQIRFRYRDVESLASRRAIAA